MKYFNNTQLKNKNIIINGGMGLIGQEVCLACIDLGANIIILDNNTEEIKKFKKKHKLLSKKFNILKLNTSSEKDIQKFGIHLNKMKKIDCYINTSYPKDKHWAENNFSNITLNSFNKNVKNNVISYCWLTNLIAEKMKKKNNGSIILLGSIYGVVAQDLSIYKGTNISENISYSFIKGGVQNYVKLMASYYGKYNLRINCISPGGVYDKDSKSQNKKFIRNYTNKVPLKRLANPSEIASAVVFFASDASSYITGTNIMVDGGWTAI